MPTRKNLRLTDEEISELFDAEYAAKFPPILTVEQAAELLQLSKSTLYEWRSRGLLDNCSRKTGKHVRFVRNRLIQTVFNGGLQ